MSEPWWTRGWTRGWARAGRRRFLRRSLFLLSFLFTACRGTSAEPGSGLTSSRSNSLAEPGAEAATSTASGSTDLPLTPACEAVTTPLPTPSQTPGPFYSPNSPQRQSLLEADTPGTRLVLTGRVLTPDCEAIANCLVDFWQADREGNYDNRGDRLRGHQFTDAEGRYRLETVVPGIYPGRTRHLHVRVQPTGGRILTTQLYLPSPLNADDFLFQPELLMAVEETAVGQQTSLNAQINAQFDFVVEAS